MVPRNSTRLRRGTQKAAVFVVIYEDEPLSWGLVLHRDEARRKNVEAEWGQFGGRSGERTQLSGGGREPLCQGLVVLGADRNYS